MEKLQKENLILLVNLMMVCNKCETRPRSVFLTWKKSIIDKTNGTFTITGSNIDFDYSACDLIIS